MPSNKLLIIVLLSCSASLSAQTFFSNKVEGRVYSKDGDVAATHIINTTTNSATITDIEGYFSIRAALNDTLVFSAIQYKKKQLLVTTEILADNALRIFLEASVTLLDEVVVTPYNLSGDIVKDLQVIRTEKVVTAQTVGLPNAHVREPSKAERELFAATANPFMSFDPLINAITGRTKMLKKRVARNQMYSRTGRVKEFFADSVYVQQLQISKDKINDLLYYCEVDAGFQTIVDTHDRLKIWDYIREKSILYRKNNE